MDSELLLHCTVHLAPVIFSQPSRAPTTLPQSACAHDFKDLHLSVDGCIQYMTVINGAVFTTLICFRTFFLVKCTQYWRRRPHPFLPYCTLFGGGNSQLGWWVSTLQWLPELVQLPQWWDPSILKNFPQRPQKNYQTLARENQSCFVTFFCHWLDVSNSLMFISKFLTQNVTSLYDRGDVKHKAFHVGNAKFGGWPLGSYGFFSGGILPTMVTTMTQTNRLHQTSTTVFGDCLLVICHGQAYFSICCSLILVAPGGSGQGTAQVRKCRTHPKCIFGTWRHSCPLTKSTVRMGQKYVQTMFYITTVLIPSFFAPRCHPLCDNNKLQFYITLFVPKFCVLVPRPRTNLVCWCPVRVQNKTGRRTKSR